jgi:predicted alpha-1,2-mannosidase
MRVIFCLVAGLLVAGNVARGASGGGPLESVDLMIGVRGDGSCIPGPCVPNGSIHPSPDTLKAGNGGYAKGETGGGVVGFSQLHAQGSGGVKSYGNFLVSPQVGLAIEEAGHVSAVEGETARGEMYSARLAKYGIDCAVVPAAHSALYKFVFPKSEEACVSVDVSRKLDKAIAIDAASVKVYAATGWVTGGGHFGGNWNPAPYELYFAAQASKVPAAAGTWVGASVQKGVMAAEAKKERLGAYLQWRTEAGETIYFKIAVSFVSVEQAQAYLDREIPAWDFDAVRTAAATAWDDKLGLITIEGAPVEEQKKFYTALYHTMVQPRDRTGDNPNWKSDAPFFDDYYTLWDSWRTLFPLMAIIRPELVRDNVNAFMDRHDHDGMVATAFTQGKEMKTGQGGDEVDDVVADAYVKHIPGVDWEKAYAMLKADAEQARTPDYREKGWVAADGKHDYDWRLKSGSSTLAFAYADFCTAQMAKGLGKMDDAAKYATRAGNWKNVWNDALADGMFSGFPCSRMADGTFAKTEARKGYNTDFYEGTCWIYSYFVPGDVEGMVAKMGGREKFVARLQYALQNDLIDFTNEPSFDTLWWFCAEGRPDLASPWIDKLKSMYNLEGYPGDEDNGAMSSLYIFVTAGLYPIAGRDVYYLHGARVPKVVFQVGKGKTFTILGDGASAENMYVQSATLNGKPLERAWITHEEIMTGGTLEFVMGNKASTWGRLRE